MSTAATTLEVHWSQGPLPFRLVTDCPVLHQRAENLFRYWQMPVPPSADGMLLTPVTISAHLTPDGYAFQPSQPEHSARTFSDIPTLLRAIETDAALAVLNHPQHFLTIHGALLSRGSQAVLIVGPSQAGKSTTACALWAAGWQLLTDDVTILHSDERLASPLLRRISLRHPSQPLLGDAFWQQMQSAATCDPTPEGYVFHPDELHGHTRARTVHLAAIVFLQRLGAPEVPTAATLTAVQPMPALLSLAPYTNVIRQGGLGDAMRQLGPLVNAIPAFDLTRGPLPDMITAIESLLPGAQQ